MKKTLWAALAVVWLCGNTGCCRCWFKWPGQYPHNPAFSQCCGKPGREHFPGHGGRIWGNGAYGECHYDGHLFPGGLFRRHGSGCGEGDCGCGAGHAGGRFAGPGPGGYPGPGAPYGPGGPYGPGMMPVSPEGIPMQPAPDAMSAAQVAYPYYTIRGPRDFLMGYPPGTQPPSIGP
jgi:hypothetical protein